MSTIESLLDACIAGDRRLVAQILRDDHSLVNKADGDGFTPL